jgi:hypothetical protein
VEPFTSATPAQSSERRPHARRDGRAVEVRDRNGRRKTTYVVVVATTTTTFAATSPALKAEAERGNHIVGGR